MTDVAVYVNGRYVRHVTAKQHAREVAGKVLDKVVGFRRTAEKHMDPNTGAMAWNCWNRQLSPDELEAGVLKP